MSKDQKEVCMYCKFWKCDDKHAPEEVVPMIFGSCRINPPMVMQAGSQVDYAHATCWPKTRGGDWCGSFEEPRPDKYASIRPWQHISEIAIKIGEEPS